MVLAMAEPRMGYETRETHRRGLDLIRHGVDVSKSMLATDVTPNRLTRAKLSVQDLVGQLNGDRLGLVAFAGSAFLQAPLTSRLRRRARRRRRTRHRTSSRAAARTSAAPSTSRWTRSARLRRATAPSCSSATANRRATPSRPSGIAAAGRAAAAGVKVFTVGIGYAGGLAHPVGPQRPGFRSRRGRQDRPHATR